MSQQTAWKVNGAILEFMDDIDDPRQYEREES